MSGAARFGDGLDRRRLVPEILDGLSVDDPRARRSRADLTRINLIMRHAAIVASLVCDYLDPPQGRPLRMMELGCGDGRATLRVARRLEGRYPAAELTMLDRTPAIAERTVSQITALGWKVQVVEADAFGWLAASNATFDLALANLFLHHFEEADLRRLMQALAPRVGLLVATEPLRTLPSLIASRLVAVIGANDVTRHDAPASVRAGFRGRELGALWSPACGTVAAEGVGLPFTHAFVGRSPGTTLTGETA